ncbi:uncharacterized protein PV06_08083 [Exophiala oligosperma]|uniref:Uncharacterized protein n=2 Tax=Chaetothyriales TaxID=34395 RepID=A0A0D2BPJ8_9EURO|nr:uncharacterized protein PV06_08083 [Exophiala oligosperma]KAJ9630379.1 60S ribosomal protein L27, mitochondrial [Knufia peltigerae]KIW39472.1 hypothetical protein PV06_08083 [Exophiala oligosperma]
MSNVPTWSGTIYFLCVSSSIEEATPTAQTTADHFFPNRYALYVARNYFEMVQPSPQLCARLRFTTKQVGRGFYRGNRTGSKGAHNDRGGYIVDWRKTSFYNVPELEGFRLAPYVTLELPEPSPKIERFGSKYTPKKVDGLEFLHEWKRLNPFEYEHIINFQREQAEQIATQAEVTIDESPAQATSGSQKSI